MVVDCVAGKEIARQKVGFVGRTAGERRRLVIGRLIVWTRKLSILLSIS